MKTKNCKICDKVFHRDSKTSYKLWDARKFCSTKCQGVAKGLSQEKEKNHRFGKRNTKEHNEAIRQACKGEKNHLWKGDDVDYRSLHAWVSRWRGRPDSCEICGKGGLSGHDIQWANIDGKYRRVLDDYIRMCAKCHWHYDRQ